MSTIDALEAASPAADPLRLAGFPTHDLGLAERLIARFGDRLARTTEAGWAAWNGSVWALGAEGESQARVYAHKTASAMWDEYNAAKEAMEAAKAGGPEAKGWTAERLTRLAKAAGSAGDSARTGSMLSQAASYMRVPLSSFDPDPFRLCVENGTLETEMINAPCWVARARGVVTGHAAAKDIETADHDALWRIGDWRVRRLPDDIVEVSAPGLAEPERLDAFDMKKGLARGSHRLDYEPWHQAVRLVPHNPAHRITRMARVVYDPNAQAETWRRHIETVLPDEEDREWFQRAMGYATCGSTLSQCFLVIQNKPGSGTSTTMEVISRVLGQYARATDPRTWLEAGTMRSAADASPDRAALAGDTRLVYTEEPPKGAHLNESLINSFCGGGTPIIARDLHESQFEYLPHGLLVIACNRMPRFSPENEGLWRRIRLIRFPRQFTEAERAADPDIKAKLLAEAPGVLNWLLEGLAAWRHHGLPPHERMKDDIAQYRESSNPFVEWLGLWVAKTTNPEERVVNSDLYKHYKAWCEAEGIDGREILGVKRFGDAMDDQQIPRRKIRGVRYRLGVRLRTDAEVAGAGGDA